MRNPLRFVMASAMALVVGSSLLLSGTAFADTIKAEQAQPMTNIVKGATLKPVQAGPLRIPTITWGGDVVAPLAESEGLFKAEGLNVQLFHQDDFVQQVRGVINGETPFLRGTFGMINAASEAMHNAGTDLVVLDQITWSHGGDRLVVRPGIKSLADLKGKKIALQLDGPHMDLLTTVLASANLSLSDVHIVWLKELSVPSYDTKGQIVDARTAFQSDASIDAAFVISPDADVLTSNGAGGNGSEGSVRGAKVLFSSASASRVIADVWAVRADWFNTHQDDARKFVHAIMLSEEHLTTLINNKGTQKQKWNDLLKSSSKLLENSPSDVEGLLGDCEFVDFAGNVAFFTGNGTTRNLTVMKDEIQPAFVTLGVMKGQAPVLSANFDYTKLAAGLSNANLAAIPAPKFDANKVQAAVEGQIASEPTKWDEEGSLYMFEIYFVPNQASFTASQYATSFQKIMELSQTFGGAIITIEGHNAPDLLQKAKASGNTALASQIEQAAKNLSLKRAQAVRQAYIDYAKSKHIAVDESQFIAVGMGATHPKFAVPATKEEWQSNMRVVFRLKNVETEAESFQPGK